MESVTSKGPRTSKAARSLVTFGAVAALFAAGLTSTTPPGHAATETQAASIPTSDFRRLDETQYMRSIEQIFGAGIKVPGRFEPPLRQDGLLAIGDARVTVSPSGFEQYELRAREIAAQVLAPNRRAATVPCAPPPAGEFNAACATAFLTIRSPSVSPAAGAARGGEHSCPDPGGCDAYRRFRQGSRGWVGATSRVAEFHFPHPGQGGGSGAPRPAAPGLLLACRANQLPPVGCASRRSLARCRRRRRLARSHQIGRAG